MTKVSLTSMFISEAIADSIHRNPQRLRSTLPTALALLTIASVLYPIAQAQNAPLLSSVNDQTRTPVQGEGHDYQKMLGETIDYSNGSLTFKISFPTPSGRGISLPYAWTYSSSAVNTLDSTDGNTPAWNLEYQHPWPQKDGWNIAEGIPKANVQVFSVTPPSGPPGQNLVACNMQSGMTFTDGGGVQHNLYTGAQVDSVDNVQNDFSICQGAQTILPPGGDGEVAATIYPQAAANMMGSQPMTGYFLIEDKNGTVYTFDDSASPGSSPVTAYVTEMEDKNGNYIYFPGPNGAAWVDTMGRSGPILASNQAATTVTIDNLTYTATWSTESVSYTVTESGGASSSSGTGCTTFPTTVTGTKAILTSLALPNGQQYQFFYGTYGLLSEVIFPDGGWIKYTWQMSPQPYELASLGGMATTNNGTTPVPYGCNWNYTVPVLASRTVSFDGTKVAQSQTFNFSATWSYTDNIPNDWTQKTATVYTTDQIVSPNLTAEVYYTYIPWGYPAMPYATSNIANFIPLESTITYYDWGQSSPSKMVTKTWSINQYNSPKLLTETTKLYGAGGTSRTSETVYSYTSGLCSNPSLSSFVYPSEQDDYDYGSGGVGPLKKKTIYNYTCFAAPHVATYANWNAGPPNNMWGSSYQGMVLPPQLSSITIEDGNGTVQAETLYGYDGYALKSVSAGQFDQNYANVTIRSNLTSVTRCTASFGPTCTGPSTTYAYDVTGQVASMTDPKTNTTKFSFADCFTDQNPTNPTNGYLTNITYPPGVAAQENFCYSYQLGYLTQSLDENNHLTTYTYADVLNRLTQIQYPDTGEKQYSYNDSAHTVTTSVLQNSSSSITNVATRDGMFHTIETQLTSDPLLTDIVNIAFDGEGRVYQKSNPYRGSGSNGTTTSRYDAFGNPIETIEQDGSTIQMCYNGLPSSPSQYCSSGQLGSTSGSSNSGSYGSWVDTTDELGNHWQRVSDAFGRLIQVMEPNGLSQTASMETDYQYDTLNDLKEVDQYGGAYGNSTYVDRQRTFTYDSLARLLSATNPETGAVTYSYLSGGSYCAGDMSLPCVKTDHRGIGINYAYDPRNRITAKTYTSDPNGTPLTCYQYDATNQVGLLSALWTMPKSSSCNATMPSSGFLTARQFTYDKMNRITGAQQQQCIGSTCSAPAPYSLTIGYDLAGETTSLSNSVGAQGSPLTLSTIYFNGAPWPCLLTQTSTWPSSGFSPNLFQANSSTSTPGYTAYGSLQNWYLGSSSSTASTNCSASPSSTMNPQQVFDSRMRVTNFSSTGQVP